MVETPSKIRRVPGQGLEIQWRSSPAVLIPNQQLRANCPCALCREQRGDESHAKPLTGTPARKSMLKVIEHTKDESLALQEIWAVGSYALGMRWGDGHDSGIYNFELLKQLSSGSN